MYEEACHRRVSGRGDSIRCEDGLSGFVIVRTAQELGRKIVYQRICEVDDDVQLRFVEGIVNTQALLRLALA